MRNVRILWAAIAILFVGCIVLGIFAFDKSNQQLLHDNPPDHGNYKPGHEDDEEDNGDDKNNQNDTNSPIIAEVGPEKITYDELLMALELEYGMQLLDEMINQKVLRLEANKLGIDVSQQEVKNEIEYMSQGYESEQKFYESMETQLGLTKQALLDEAYFKLLAEKIAMAPIEITDEEIEDYIRTYPEEFAPRIEIRLAQIIVETEEEAYTIIEDVMKGIAFHILARERSLDELSATQGGDLGWMEEGDPFIHNNIMHAATQLAEGEVSAPIDLGNSFAVIRLLERSVMETKDVEEVRARLKVELALQQAMPIKELLIQLREDWETKINFDNS